LESLFIFLLCTFCRKSTKTLCKIKIYFPSLHFILENITLEKDMRILSTIKSLFVGMFMVAILFAFPQILFAQTSPVINEFSVHPSSGNKEWVELYVFDKTDLKTYWIDDDASFLDDSGTGTKKRLSEITPGHDEHLFSIEISSLFNNDGDVVALFDTDGKLLDQITYTSDPGVDMTIGRTPDGTGSFQFLEKATKGENNSPPLPSDTTTPDSSSNQSVTPEESTIGKSIETASTSDPSETNTKAPSNSLPSKESGKRSTSTHLQDFPTPILRVSTDSAQKKASQSAKKKILIKDAQGKNPAAISAMLGGGVLFIACGILIFLKKRSLL
jgi:hypothetical protein